MTYAELIALYFERSNALQWYWTLYVIAIGGLLAFSSFRTRRDFITTFLVTLFFCLFAYKNLGGIHETTVQRLATLQAIKEYSSTEQNASAIKQSRNLLEPTLSPSAYEGVRNFHILSDVLAVAAIWAKERRRDPKA